MCDQHSLGDMAEHLHATTGLTRREFGAAAAAVAAYAALPRVANAAEVKSSDVVIKTPDGEAEAFFVAPSGGKSPAVLIWVDAFGLRPAFRQMATRLAESGYAVLVPNPYYRVTKVPALPEGLDFGKPDDRAKIMALMSKLTPETNVTDAKAFVAWLDARPEVDAGKKMATTGYCMGGAMVMRTAATLPNRIGAGATFHGGGLATKNPNSPHLLIPQMKASYLIAIAANDDKADPEAKNTLRAAFDAAKLKAEIEVYTGAAHGWCPPDQAVYHKEQAEKAWARQLALFKTALV